MVAKETKRARMPRGRKRVEEIFRILSEHIDPRSDLEYSNNFELLIAVILSAQCTDKQVNKVTEPLFKELGTPEDMLAVGEAALATRIRSIGLYRGKAKNIIKTCRLLIERHAGEVPGDRAALRDLPGVGKKTAGVVMNVGFGAPTIPVDTHVFRVSRRLDLAQEKTPDKTEDALVKVVPERYRGDAHHLMILHGRYTCKARSPLCEECRIAHLCRSEDKTIPPRRRAKKA